MDKDEFLEGWHVKGRRHYLGIVARAERACRLAPHFGIRLRLRRVFVYAPPPFSNAFVASTQEFRVHFKKCAAQWGPPAISEPQTVLFNRMNVL